MSVPGISDANPTWSDWTGAAGVTENTNKVELDFGSVVASTNSTHKNLSVEFGSGFDDTAFNNLRFYLVNHPGLTSHTWYAKPVTVATTPATVALTAGAAIGSNFYTATQLLAGTYYLPADNAIRYLQLQLQVGATPTLWNSEKEHLTNPILHCAIPRANETVSKMRADYGFLDALRETLFTYGGVNIYEEVGGRWLTIAEGVKEDSIEITDSVETVEWGKSKPYATFHQVISKIMSEIKVKNDNIAPYFKARALHTVAVENATDSTVDIDINAKSRPAITGKYVFEWRTIGGFLRHYTLPRASLTQTGGYAPGATDFAGTEFLFKGLANGVNRSVATDRVTLTPVEIVAIPLIFAVA